ncbi:unnamed protein product, partial [Iphiclides podalirius]
MEEARSDYVAIDGGGVVLFLRVKRSLGKGVLTVSANRLQSKVLSRSLTSENDKGGEPFSVAADGGPAEAQLEEMASYVNFVWGEDAALISPQDVLRKTEADNLPSRVMPGTTRTVYISNNDTYTSSDDDGPAASAGSRPHHLSGTIFRGIENKYSIQVTTS